MKQMKEILFSERGMEIVFHKSGFVFIAYLAWIVYLLCCIRHTNASGSKIICSAFIGIAAVMICLNLYFLLRD